MRKSLVAKLIEEHLVSGMPEAGCEIGIRIDQTLTQDATGTMAYLQFEALGAKRVKTELSVSYVDHNTLQTGFENADDHAYLQSVAAKHGIVFSRPGNGICHQVHLERFAKPGRTLLGSDSHTPTAGGMGMLAIGAGGLDVAVAMGGGAFHLIMPKVVRVWLTGSLKPGVSAKDVILHILGKLTVKGGVGKVLEYAGPGVAALSVPERATITNMGAELGATTSIFPSDSTTRSFLEAQNRASDWVELSADEGAEYDEEVAVDLASLVPLAAKPHSPDAVAAVSSLAGMPVDQVCIGSCTNSSLLDMRRVAAILDGRKVHPNVSLAISPGSRQVLETLARDGSLAKMISSGARILETTCGPCIGMGQSPKSGAVSLRTFNRNFEGRSGTADAGVYLVSPETAAASAVAGVMTDPTADSAVCAKITGVEMPSSFLVDDGMLIHPLPEGEAEKAVVTRGPNIKPLPTAPALPESLRGEVLLVLGDGVTTDHIMPAGSKVLPLRSNIPAISKYVFSGVDASFSERALALKAAGRAGIVVAGMNYGQGSSREHAALGPMYLGVRAVVALSFARIHKDNLINFGILPLVFADESDYGLFAAGDEVALPDVARELREGSPITLENARTGKRCRLCLQVSPRQAAILLAGGLLNYTRC